MKIQRLPHTLCLITVPYPTPPAFLDLCNEPVKFSHSHYTCPNHNAASQVQVIKTECIHQVHWSWYSRVRDTIWSQWQVVNHSVQLRCPCPLLMEDTYNIQYTFKPPPQQKTLWFLCWRTSFCLSVSQLLLCLTIKRVLWIDHVRLTVGVLRGGYCMRSEPHEHISKMIWDF